MPSIPPPENDASSTAGPADAPVSDDGALRDLSILAEPGATNGASAIAPSRDGEADGADAPVVRAKRKRAPRKTYPDGSLTRVFKFPCRKYPRSSYYVTGDEIIIRIKKGKKRWKLLVSKKRLVSYRTNRWFTKPRWVEIELTYTQALRCGLVERASKHVVADFAETPVTAELVGSNELGHGVSADAPSAETNLLELGDHVGLAHEAALLDADVIVDGITGEGVTGESDDDSEPDTDAESDTAGMQGWVADDDDSAPGHEEAFDTFEEIAEGEAAEPCAEENDDAILLEALVEKAEAVEQGQSGGAGVTAQTTSDTAQNIEEDPAEDAAPISPLVCAGGDIANGSHPSTTLPSIIEPREEQLTQANGSSETETVPDMQVAALALQDDFAQPVAHGNVTPLGTAGAVASAVSADFTRISEVNPSRPLDDTPPEPRIVRRKRRFLAPQLIAASLVALVAAALLPWAALWDRTADDVADAGRCLPTAWIECPVSDIVTGSTGTDANTHPESTHPESTHPESTLPESTQAAVTHPAGGAAEELLPSGAEPEPVAEVDATSFPAAATTVETTSSPEPLATTSADSSALVESEPVSEGHVPASPDPVAIEPPHIELSKLNDERTTNGPSVVPDVEPALCRGRVADLARDTTVQFNFASATITHASQQALDRLAAAMKPCKGVRLVIEGHTDSDGDTRRNQLLSLRRAIAVWQYLGTSAGDNQLVVIGYGQERPLVPNDTDANKSRNRRIRLVLE